MAHLDTVDITTNPLLHEYRHAVDGDPFGCFQVRSELVSRYAWAVPDEQAIAALAAAGPIAEIGAGTGYWAALVAAAGGDVVAYDTAPPGSPLENSWCHDDHQYHPVTQGGPWKAADHPDRALFLCWPPHESSMAADALDAYTGDTVVYVGESRGGCTGDERFHDMLAEQFEELHVVRIPTWPAIHDDMSIHRRR